MTFTMTLQTIHCNSTTMRKRITLMRCSLWRILTNPHHSLSAWCRPSSCKRCALPWLPPRQLVCAKLTCVLTQKAAQYGVETYPTLIMIPNVKNKESFAVYDEPNWDVSTVKKFFNRFSQSRTPNPMTQSRSTEALPIVDANSMKLRCTSDKISLCLVAFIDETHPSLDAHQSLLKEVAKQTFEMMPTVWVSSTEEHFLSAFDLKAGNTPTFGM